MNGTDRHCCCDNSSQWFYQKYIFFCYFHYILSVTLLLYMQVVSSIFNNFSIFFSCVPFLLILQLKYKFPFIPLQLRNISEISCLWRHFDSLRRPDVKSVCMYLTNWTSFSIPRSRPPVLPLPNCCGIPIATIT